MKKKTPTKVSREIVRLRKNIDRADAKLLRAFKERFDAVDTIGLIKVAQGAPLKQRARWKLLLDDRLLQSAKLGLNPLFIKAVYSLIHSEALRRQKKIAATKKKRFE